MFQQVKNNFSTLKSGFLILALLFLIQHDIFPQMSLDSYVEAGSNAVSEGFYSDFSAKIEGQTGSLSTSLGGLLSFSNAKENILSAVSFTVANDFKLKTNHISLQGFYLWKPISSDMRETNFGLLAKYKFEHWGLQLGANSRFYKFTPSAILQYNLADSARTTLWEPFNLMYRLSYYQLFTKKLNLEAAVTNFDRYFIQQETNPMILLALNYKLNSRLKFYTELGYMQAGLLNLHVNAFGVYLRGGVIWQID